MELITPELLNEIIKNSGESEDIKEVLTKHGEAAVGHGENYCSNIIRANFKVKLASGKIINRRLILKTFIQSLEGDVHAELKMFFANEVTMYDKILGHLGKMAEKYNLESSRIWPKCYFANTDVIVFEDLKDEGFVVAPRQAGLKIEDALQVISYLGRLHALSIVAQQRGIIDPSLIRETYTWVQTNNWTSTFMKKSFKILGEIIKGWGAEWEYAGSKIMEYSNTICQHLNELFYEKVKLRVVNHGDAWINNIMIKYKEDNTTFEDLRFVDFQNAAYNSYAWDIVYFMYTSLLGQVLRANYDKLIISYKNEFEDTLKILGSDPGIAPSIAEIKEELSRLDPFSLAISCTVTAAVFNTSKQQIQIDELASNDQKLKNLYTSDNYKTTMKSNIKYFLEQNVL